MRQEEAPGKPQLKTQELPFSVVGKLRYDERRLPALATGSAANRRTANNSTNSSTIARLRSLRYYHQADAVRKVKDEGNTPALADDHRLVLVESAGGRATFTCPTAPLDRDQLDLVDALGNTLFLEGLLPKQPVADGGTWNQDSATMGGLLSLDSVADCHIQSVLQEYNAQFAKIRLAGVVHGMVDGAATELEIRGVYLVNRETRQLTRLLLSVREKRAIGAATPGLEAVAKLSLAFEPLASCEELSDAVVAALPNSAHSSADMPLVFDAHEQGFRVTADRQWFLTDRQRESITLRRVDSGDLVAQCTIKRLPHKSAGRQTTLAEFVEDIRVSLGKNFGQLVSSREWTNTHGHACLEVVARGTIDEVPVEWHYYLVAPESGHRASVSVTIEGPQVERLGRADRDLVNSLELVGVQLERKDTAALPKR
jgi:hypothetical protein